MPDFRPNRLLLITLPKPWRRRQCIINYGSEQCSVNYSSMEKNGDSESVGGEKMERNGSAIEDKDITWKTLLVLSFLSQEEACAAGGSGILLKTTNSGKSWSREKAVDDIAANLYSVKFINERQGFVLGNDGIFL
ncbi:hypothetical protein L1987_14692 [Smallanthus sonchifolius]|uniref:Uncharacterized protein n=1 Tax=Smallanthus sonchifolius TaxID=185202 RepID=A0ACB9J426_9ASTR|nr:hypothetical protein L1987_14692 [Smallanthus sonchifolius]